MNPAPLAQAKRNLGSWLGAIGSAAVAWSLIVQAADAQWSGGWLLVGGAGLALFMIGYLMWRRAYGRL